MYWIYRKQWLLRRRGRSNRRALSAPPAETLADLLRTRCAEDALAQLCRERNIDPSSLYALRTGAARDVGAQLILALAGGLRVSPARLDAAVRATRAEALSDFQSGG